MSPRPEDFSSVDDWRKFGHGDPLKSNEDLREFWMTIGDAKALLDDLSDPLLVRWLRWRLTMAERDVMPV